MLGSLLPCVCCMVLLELAAPSSEASSSWSSIIQSGDPQPHEMSGQLREMGWIKWGSAADDPTAAVGSPPRPTVVVDAATKRQAIFGFGGAFTESAAFVWGNLSAAAQKRVLDAYWGPDGIGYTTGRMTMNSPDFALGHYSYANVSGDFALASFQHDLPRDNEWVLPFLRAAIKTAGKPGTLRLFSAPWSPPAWMKVPFNDWPENDTEPDPQHLGAMDICRPDSLLNSSNVRSAWALYFSKWHSAMATQLGQQLWGYSAQNEPLAHGHMWDCCGYTPESYTSFISTHLMPRMQADHPYISFLAFDHNPDAIEQWANATYSDPARRAYAWGTAVHWYSAEKQRGVNLNKTHLEFPDKPILHTEGCACRSLPFPSFPHGSTESWWSVGEGYGIGLMQYLQNWATGFTDWNLVLDAEGGPSHDRRFGCNAPFMQCPQHNASCAPDGLAVQAPFFFMAHFAKYLVPGSTIIGAMRTAGGGVPPAGQFYYEAGAEGADGQLGVLAAVQPNGTAVLVVLNTGDSATEYTLRDARMGGQAVALLSIPPHSIQTLRWNVP